VFYFIKLSINKSLEISLDIARSLYQRQSKQAIKSNLLYSKCEGTRLKKKESRDCNSKRDMLSLYLAN